MAAFPLLSCLFPCRCIVRASQYVFVFCPTVSCVKRRNVFSLFIASASTLFFHPTGILKIDAHRSISVITRLLDSCHVQLLVCYYNSSLFHLLFCAHPSHEGGVFVLL